MYMMTINAGKMSIDLDSKPRHMVYSKMVSLIYRMQNVQTGIQLRNKKNFLTTVPQAFSGSDLLLWLSEHLAIVDAQETQHLATLICHYGYIYPVDIKNFIVRDDKSILYRFQIPYFWPCKNQKLTNEQFMIYLLKRSKRNKAKHGLDEFEQNALSKLQIVFSDKITFLRSQAEEQVKQVKQLRRDDKQLKDSQERAFWRIQRPQPGCVKCIEDSPSRYFQPSAIENRKKNNKDLVFKYVKYLRRAMGRPRMKLSKVIEFYMQRNRQYLEYDPLIDPSAAQPSNPWISEDETMWNINGRVVEIPTTPRIRKWSLSFDELLSDITGQNEFEHFLKKEYSQENIRFWKACKDLKLCPQSKVPAIKKDIEGQFLTVGAPCEVNIDAKTMEGIIRNLREDKQPNRCIFEPAQEHIYTLMKKDSYPRFLRSEQYKNLILKSQEHYSKKRFFSFGSGKKPKASPQLRRRGSASSDGISTDNDVYGASHHSYSTGNLQELVDSPKHAVRQQNSPSSLRRRPDDTSRLTNAAKDPRRKSNLDVPRHSGGQPSSAYDTRKSEALPCINITVPGKSNVVAPWEGGK